MWKESTKKLLFALAVSMSIGMATDVRAEPEKDIPANVQTTVQNAGNSETGVMIGSDNGAAVEKPAEQPVPVAAVPAPAPAKVEPPLPKGFVKVSDINSGDTSWMLSASALVLLMTLPGLALFYGGMTRKKNVINTFMMVFAASCVVAVAWVVAGYSLSFSEGGSFIGDLSRFFMKGLTFDKNSGLVAVHPAATNIPETLYASYQMTFAIITAALVIGAFVERVRFSALLAFILAWHFLVYVPIAHWVWSPNGWLASLGVLDFAGGMVVHINAGMAGLMFAMLAGRRKGFPEEPMPPHNLSLMMTGAAMLWVGWFGFNAGSAVAADGRASMAFLVTFFAAAVAALSWMFTEWAVRGKPTILGIASGAVAGLVAITPASGFVDVFGAFVIGLLAGPLCWFGASGLKKFIKIDDSLDVFGVHGVGGLLGSVMTPLLNVPAISGLKGNFPVQILGTLAVAIYSAIVSVIIIVIIKKVIGLRVTEKQEERGLDLSQHGESIEHE